MAANSTRAGGKATKKAAAAAADDEDKEEEEEEVGGLGACVCSTYAHRCDRVTAEALGTNRSKEREALLECLDW